MALVLVGSMGTLGFRWVTGPWGPFGGGQEHGELLRVMGPRGCFWVGHGWRGCGGPFGGDRKMGTF